MTRVETATKIAWSFLGRPYVWGGNDPNEGFDCSGLCIEILKSVGVLPRTGDWTAAMLRQKFPSIAVPREGCLVFYQNGLAQIIHVEYCLDNELSIGASGGGSNTLTTADAMAQDAYVKVRPFKTRNGLAGYADPFQA